MWIVISKIGPYLVYPLSLMFLLTMVALVCWLFRWRKTGNTLLTTGLIVLYLGACPALGWRLFADLERKYLPQPIEEIPNADAIITLGGSLGLPLWPRITWDINPSSDRIWHAAELFKHGKAPMVVVSAGNIFKQDAAPESFYIAEVLKEWGVDENAILFEGRSRNTYENALYTKKLLQDRRVDSALLVTSAAHMPRALATFQKAGINVIPAPTDFRVVGINQPSVLGWLPNAGALFATNFVIREYLGMWVYRVRGWVGK